VVQRLQNAYSHANADGNTDGHGDALSYAYVHAGTAETDNNTIRLE